MEEYLKSNQTTSNNRDENGTMTNPSPKMRKEESVHVSSRVYSGPIIEVDNDEHQSMQVESDKEKKDKGM